MLPPDLGRASSMPLIVLGPDCTLRITNGTVYNASSLAACLSLGPGANFFAEESDGVQLQHGAPTHLADPAAAQERATEQARNAHCMQPLATTRSKDIAARMQVLLLLLDVCAAKGKDIPLCTKRNLQRCFSKGIKKGWRVKLARA